MLDQERRMDRRAQRTRQLLHQAFRDVVHDEGFAGASVSAIAERADVNRGTFYLHFPDKYTLAEAVVREVFRQRLTGALPHETTWDRRSLEALIQATLDCLEDKYCHRSRA